MKAVERWFVEHVVPLGAPGLFLLALIDSSGVPIPQGVDVLLFVQTIAHPRGALLYASLATLGSLAGCVFLYYVSRAAGHAALVRRTSPERIDAMRQQFEKYEALTLVLPTMIPLPLPMKLFIIAAGVFEVRLPHFIGAILFARAVRYFGIALLARNYGDQAWTYLRQHLAPVLIGVLLLLGLFYLASRRLR